ncbi:hypothetical protein [Methanobrevibacter boviskoreani]|uniref:hypothetical protein n=1 Tax=Methanobrevibacter boviskoreani TaxID=1348249 RepID=UPI0023A7CE33|nr:hypothetical protein [Methanobrevibacter boviskoreani]MCI6774423.1 hypothetical protein [Methanobrevibacter boviskoreani]MCI6930107.1 hypothetical protein [Methanobrevibacter boviskoreani]
MKTTEEIQKRSNYLNESTKNILNSNERLDKEKQIVSVESQVEETFLKTLIGKEEGELKELLIELEAKSRVLNSSLEKQNDSKSKHKSQAKVWTNNIKINAIKWILKDQ